MLFFDEIQVVPGWEFYIRQKLDENYRVFITGSNATLLSPEMGTKLTGRHLSKELFPFSYNEFCDYLQLAREFTSLEMYMNKGGFPEYIKTPDPEIIKMLTDDILYRDIAVRHHLKDVNSLKRLLVYLASNIGNLVSATRLTNILGIKSSVTILDYFSFFEQSYMMQLVPKFSYSYKVQLVNPRKIYFIDNGLINILSASFNMDLGHKLENIVFWELRRRQKTIYYYNENGKECDFVLGDGAKPQEMIQVCYELNHDNEKREIDGLLDAMNYFKINTGYIITANQHDVIYHGGKEIIIIPAWEWLNA